MHQAAAWRLTPSSFPSKPAASRALTKLARRSPWQTGSWRDRLTSSGGHVNSFRPIASIALLSLFAVSSGALGAPSDGPTSRPGQDNNSAIVQLKGDPLSTSAKTKPPKGKKIDFDSSTVKSYRANLSALRNDFKTWLRANAPGAKVTGEFDIS